MNWSKDEKPVAWLGGSRAIVRGFPPEARSRFGCALHRVQFGLSPSHWRPMRSVGHGVCEVRVRIGVGGRVDYRLLYVATFPEAVYVLHAFSKSTRTTSRSDLELGRQRYAELMAHRRQRSESDGD